MNRTYQRPDLELFTVSAEKGFAASDEENPLFFDDGGEAIDYEW